MASPQKENGFTPTAHELVEAICALNISGTAHRVLRYIERKTYGFNKKKDYVSISQFEVVLKTDRRTIIRALDALEKSNIIIINRDNITNEYCINKDYDTWVGGKTPLGGKKAQTRGQNAPKGRGQNALYKRNKETKEISKTSLQKNMPIKGYNENQHNDDIPTIGDDGELVIDNSIKETNEKITALIAWAEKIRGKKFLDTPTQRKMLHDMRKNKISPQVIKDTYVSLVHSKYWQEQERLPDFKTVLSALKNKK